MAKILLVLACPTFRAKFVRWLVEVRSEQRTNGITGGIQRVFGDSRVRNSPNIIEFRKKSDKSTPLR